MHRVVLCLVRPYDGLGRLLDTNFLVTLFGRCGRLADVRIFERAVLIKAFIEFESYTGAANALSQIHEVDTEFGWLCTYPSKKNRIMRTHSRPFTEDLSVDNMGRPADGHPEDYKRNLYVSQEQSNSQFPVSQSQKDELVLKLYPSSLFPPSLTSDGVGMAPSQSPLSSIPMTCFKVVIINRLYNKQITHGHLVALFSCFGPVLKVLVHSHHSYALVEFERPENALDAANGLRRVSLFNCPLKTKLSKYAALNFRTLEKDASQLLRYHYAESGRPNKLDLPGRALRPQSSVLVAQCPPALTPGLIWLLVSQVHEPLDVFPLANGLPGAFCVRFSAVEKAVEVLATFDGEMVDDRRLCIAFTQEEGQSADPGTLSASANGQPQSVMLNK